MKESGVSTNAYHGTVTEKVRFGECRDMCVLAWIVRPEKVDHPTREEIWEYCGDLSFPSYSVGSYPVSP